MLFDIIFDLVLIMGFGITHSILASFKSKKISSYFIPPYLYRILFSLVTATYILSAAYFWRNIDYIIYAVPAPYDALMDGLVIIGWMMYFYSHLFYYEVGGVFGTSQLFAHAKVTAQIRSDFSTNGIKRYIRFPVHTAFMPMFLALPTMTVSTLIFAVVAAFYAWAGTLHHDHRFSKLFGEDYDKYKKHSGMVFPRVRSGKVLSYNRVIIDATPRKFALALILALVIFLGVKTIIVTHYWGELIILDKTNLFIIPLLTVTMSAIAISSALLFIRKYQFTQDKALNLYRSESVAFAAGVAAAINLGFLFGLTYFQYGTLPNLAAAIPSWVLSLLIMHLIYFGIEKFVWKRANRGLDPTEES